MIPIVERLGESLALFAHQRIGAAEYDEAHRCLVLQTLISWEGEAVLWPYLPRLIYYCLECPEAAPDIVSLTYQYMVGERDLNDYADRLHLEFSIQDRQNTVPWPYVMRTQSEAGQNYFLTIIKANVPIDPGRIFWHKVRTTKEGQEFAHIELLSGKGFKEQLAPRFLHRVRLPPGLPKGQVMHVGISRMDEQGLRIMLSIPARDRHREGSWCTEISNGFWDLAEVVRQKTQRPPKKNTAAHAAQVLLRAIMRYLNDHWHLMQEEDRNRLIVWVQSTSGALAKGDERSLALALRRMSRDAQSGNEALALALSTLLNIITADQEAESGSQRFALELLGLDDGPDSELLGDRDSIDRWNRESTATHEITKSQNLEVKQEPKRENIVDFLKTEMAGTEFKTGVNDVSVSKEKKQENFIAIDRQRDNALQQVSQLFNRYEKLIPSIPWSPVTSRAGVFERLEISLNNTEQEKAATDVRWAQDIRQSVRHRYVLPTPMQMIKKWFVPLAYRWYKKLRCAGKQMANAENAPKATEGAPKPGRVAMRIMKNRVAKFDDSSLHLREPEQALHNAEIGGGHQLLSFSRYYWLYFFSQLGVQAEALDALAHGFPPAEAGGSLRSPPSDEDQFHGESEPTSSSIEDLLEAISEEISFY